MPAKWESAPLVESAPKWMTAPLVDAEGPTPKKQPSFASRFLENTVKPIEVVSDSIQSAMRSQNPIGELVTSAGGAAKDYLKRVAESRSAKAGNPFGAVVEPLAESVFTAGQDLAEGNPGAAVGGLAGLALPFLPKSARAAANVDRAAVSAASKGTLKAGAKQVPDLLTKTDVTRPLKAIPDVFNAIREAVRGGRAALDDLAAQRRVGVDQRPNVPRVNVPVEPLADATPIPGRLPSGRVPGMPQTRPQRPAPVWNQPGQQNQPVGHLVIDHKGVTREIPPEGIYIGDSGHQWGPNGLLDKEPMPTALPAPVTAQLTETPTWVTHWLDEKVSNVPEGFVQNFTIDGTGKKHWYLEQPTFPGPHGPLDGPAWLDYEKRVQGATNRAISRRMNERADSGAATASAAPPPIAPPPYLPSGRVPGRPMTKVSRAAPAWQNLPDVAPADSPASTPIPGELPSGRHPMTAAERQAKYGKPLPGPDNSARVSVKPEPGSPMGRLNPEQVANAQALAAEYGGAPLPEAAATPQFEAGARAKKVWGMSDLLAEHGITAEDAALMTDAMWKQATEAINKANQIDWQGAKAGTKRPNRHAVPGAQSRAEIVNELREIEARKAATQ